LSELVVIGGGPAGVTGALRARELEAEVILIEREKLGGTCTNDGCVPTRALANGRLPRPPGSCGTRSSLPTLRESGRRRRS
jgi:flavin-dependent dehydrogenase